MTIREIVLDTETTGLDPKTGDRVVEIGCVELENHVPTGRTHHVYINPERSMPEGAFKVHGLSEDFLSRHPVFADIAAAFVEFVDGAKLVIHNASFDIGFLNMELSRLDYPPIPPHTVVDTLELARRKHPGTQNSLDALCSRYGVEAGHRTLHGALLDAKLLADVYLELIGGRQSSLSLASAGSDEVKSSVINARGQRPEKLAARLTDEEIAQHRAFVETLGDAPVWADYDDCYKQSESG